MSSHTNLLLENSQEWMFGISLQYIYTDWDSLRIYRYWQIHLGEWRDIGRREGGLERTWQDGNPGDSMYKWPGDISCDSPAE